MRNSLCPAIAACVLTVGFSALVANGAPPKDPDLPNLGVDYLPVTALRSLHLPQKTNIPMHPKDTPVLQSSKQLSHVVEWADFMYPPDLQCFSAGGARQYFIVVGSCYSGVANQDVWLFSKSVWQNDSRWKLVYAGYQDVHPQAPKYGYPIVSGAYYDEDHSRVVLIDRSAHHIVEIDVKKINALLK